MGRDLEAEVVYRGRNQPLKRVAEVRIVEAPHKGTTGRDRHVVVKGKSTVMRCESRMVLTRIHKRSSMHLISQQWTRMPRCGPSGFSERFFFIQVVASSVSRAGQDPGAGRTILLSREALDLLSLLRARMEDSEPRMPPA